MYCNKKILLFVLVLIILIATVTLATIMMNKQIEKFDITTTTLPQTTMSQQVSDTNTLYQKIATLNDKINRINSVENKDAKLIFDEQAYKHDFANSLKDNAALIIDSQLKQASLTSNNDTAISQIDSQISDLEQVINKMNIKKELNTPYSKIKSLNNGQELNLISQTYTDDETGNNKQGYQVNFNNGCLAVGQNDYDIYKCDPTDKKQTFKMVNILNNIMYSNNIDKLLPYATVDTSNTQYPFALMKSYNNDNCLTNNHGQITVQPCGTSVSQRWLPVEN